MKPVLWYQGRFSWAVIALYVYVTVCVLTFDYVWRRVEAPFLILLLSGIFVWIAGSGIILSAARQFQRKRDNHE